MAQPTPTPHARRYMFPPVSARTIPRMRREILSMRAREAGVEREIAKTRSVHTHRAQLVRAAAAERTCSDVKRLQKLERELEGLAARKSALFDTLKQSLVVPISSPTIPTLPTINTPAQPGVPASYAQIRKNLRAGKAISPTIRANTNNNNKK